MFIVEQVGMLPIFHAHTKDRELLALAFLRMQEHYESPRFRGKVFTHQEYRRWYTEERGSFSYVNDWSGFNVPSLAVRKVCYEFLNHSRQEKALFRELCETEVFRHQRFYLIGTCGTHPETLRHEICHGLYFTSRHYKDTARSVIKRYSLDELRRQLSTMGYHQSVHDDEAQAYAMGYWSSDMSVTREMRAFRKELRRELNPIYAALTAR